jgi:NAD(P)-dependent dehydrogenase (short-subunit alcohol dehydrogenase family)
MSSYVVLITGANNGIGLHLAENLVINGYRVAGFDLSGENLASLCESHPENCMFCKCDITLDEDVRCGVDQVVMRWERIDVLVNNACLALFTPFQDKQVEDVKREFEVNYFGAVRMIQAVLPIMRAQHSGIIHNVSSGVGITGFPRMSGYTSTKGALEALTRTLTLELRGTGITVNLFHPPLTNTNSAGPLGLPAQVMEDPAKVGKQFARKILSKNAVIANDLRGAVYLFLAYRYPLVFGKLFASLSESSK